MAAVPGACVWSRPSVAQQRGQAGPKRASLALARWARMGRWAACLPPAGAGALNRHGRASEQHERAEADHRHGRWEANLSGEGAHYFPRGVFFEFVSWGMQAKTLEVTCFQHFSTGLFGLESYLRRMHWRLAA